MRSTLHVEGIPLHVIDTAGLRETHDEIERIGIARTWREIEKADVVVLIVDARQGVCAADQAILAQLPQGPARITVQNKIDLAGKLPERHAEPSGTVVSLSAREGSGVEFLKQELLRIAGWHPAEDVFIARERHVRALAETSDHLERSRACLPHLELFAEELRMAQKSLGAITGDFSSDDLLGEIFGRFCIGK